MPPRTQRQPVRSGMPGIEHHRRALERHLADLESLLAGAERKFRVEGEIGRAVVGRWVTRAGCSAAHAHRVLAGFRREAALREARAGEPVARRARRYFTRDSPLLLRLKLCWELERALCNMDDVLREARSLVSKSDCLVEMPGGSRDVAGKEAVVRALLDDRHPSARVLLIVDPRKKTATKGGGSGKSSLATAVFNDPRVRSHFVELVAWRRVPQGLEDATVDRAVVIVSDMLRGRDDQRGATKVSPAAGAPGDEAVDRRERFLLVVDGVWNNLEERRNWENDMMPRLRSDSLRAPGSMVVVTTRRRPAVATIFR